MDENMGPFKACGVWKGGREDKACWLMMGNKSFASPSDVWASGEGSHFSVLIVLRHREASLVLYWVQSKGRIFITYVLNFRKPCSELVCTLASVYNFCG